MTSLSRIAHASPVPAPDEARIGGRDRERADRRDRHAVGDRRPVAAAVGGLPHATRRRAGVVDEGIAGHARDRGDAIADNGADEAECESLLRPRAAASLREGHARADWNESAREKEMFHGKDLNLAARERARHERSDDCESDVASEHKQ